MGFLSRLGFGVGTKVRYAVVGAAAVAEEATLTSFARTGNAEIIAFITDHPERARCLGTTRGIIDSYGYAQFDAILESGIIDAVYIATPNGRHAEFAVAALRAGIHVLVEKPFEMSTEKCREITDAQAMSTAQLMVANRQHFGSDDMLATPLVASRNTGIGRFGSQLKYFSDCIIAGSNPEPYGEEDFADVRVMDGILRALHLAGDRAAAITLPPQVA